MGDENGQRRGGSRSEDLYREAVRLLSALDRRQETLRRQLDFEQNEDERGN